MYGDTNKSTTKIAFGKRDAAERYSISVETIQRAIRSGQLPAYKALSKTVIYKEDIDAWLMGEEGIDVTCGICGVKVYGTYRSLRRRKWEFGQDKTFCPAHAE